jgi:predicted RNase H-like HicB family nuclease
MKEFIALIHRDTDGTYRVSFPDFPDVMAVGQTFDEARLDAQWALLARLRSLAEREEIPEPSSLEAIMADPHHLGSLSISTIAIATVSTRMTAMKRPTIM